MATKDSTSRQAAARASRFTYLVAAAFNVLVWFLLNVNPTWQVVPFLTPETVQVLDLANAVLLVGAAMNLVYVLYDGPWFKAAGDLLVAGIGLVLAIRLWQVFPFDFSAFATDWTTVARIVVAIIALGSGIAVLAAIVRFARALFGGASARR